MRYILLVLFTLIATFASAQVQFLGSPTTTVRNRGNFVSDSLFYLPKRTKAPSDSGALRYQISDSALYVWTGSQWIKAGGGAGSITGTLTTNYLPKATGSTTLGNSIMYDSTGHVRVYGNWAGNGNSSRFLFSSEVDGQNGYGAMFRQNDSLDNNIQYVISLRKGLLTSSKPRPGFGAGYDVRLPDDTGAFRRVGSILHRLSDTTAAGLSSYMQFQVAKSGSLVNPLQISADSSIRMAKLAGSGTRYVVADANGDLTASASLASVDTFSISTRAWRQKGIDSLAGIKLNISDTASMLTPYLRKADTTAMLSPYYRSAQATAALALKVNISDTSSMLGNYIRAAGNGLTKSGQALSVDTAAIATRARVQKAVDSLGAVKGSGTVTSVSAGTGMSFTTITSTGSVAADTLTLSTRAWRQKGLDSLAGIELNISDTASMLTNYTRGSGTTNYLPKFTGSRTFGNSVAFDNGGTELLVNTTTDAGAYALQVAGSIYSTTGAVLAASSGNVGIGTTGPGYKLDVLNPTATDANILRIGMAGVSNGFTINRVASNFVYSMIDGNVGIGTTSPTSRLHVKGAINIERSSSTDFSVIDNEGNLNIKAATGGIGGDFNTVFFTGNSERMRITTTGNVGIGTLFPSEVLHVVGRGRFTTIDSTSSPINVLTSDVNGVIRKTAVPSGGVSGSGTTNYLPKFTGSTTLGNSVAYDNGGTELLVNTTTDAGAYTLQVAGTTIIKTAAVNTPLHVENTASALTYATYVNSGGTAFIGAAANDVVFATSASATERMRMTSNGELLINTTSDQGDYKLQINGDAYTTGALVRGVINVNGTGAQLSIDSTTNLSPLYFVSHKLTGANTASTITGFPEWNTTGNVNMIDFIITNTASGASSNYMRITDGTNEFKVTKAAEVVTAAPTGGSVRKWKLGEAATVSPTSPNRTIRVEIDGTIYYIHAKTTND